MTAPTPAPAGPPRRFFLTGTDTDLGKTTAAAAICAAWGHAYWKPVQAGLDGETDAQAVARLSGARTFPEAWRLRRPASPHRAAEDEGLRVDPAGLRLPTDGPLLVEGAGGWEVPLARAPWVMQAELPRTLDLDVILVARTGLGTLNHSRTAARAIAADGLRLVGLVLIGPPHPENEADLPALCGAPVLCRLPRVADRDADFAALVAAARAWAPAGVPA